MINLTADKLKALGAHRIGMLPQSPCEWSGFLTQRFKKWIITDMA